jgi:hypothetical protein
LTYDVTAQLFKLGYDVFNEILIARPIGEFVPQKFEQVVGRIEYQVHCLHKEGRCLTFEGTEF